jgi:hypothetical protein
MAGNNVSLYGSVGPTLSISGLGPRFVAQYGKQFTLGRGLPGFVPQRLVDTDVGYEDYMNDRDTVVEGWNTNYRREINALSGKPARAITPFRAINNAGDLLSRKYYTCGGPCQTFQSRPGMFGLKQRFGAIMLQCDGTGVEPAACNTKYVYDSSDYSRYLKQRSINQTYNNLSNGGDNSSASQSAWRAIRRF